MGFPGSAVTSNLESQASRLLELLLENVSPEARLKVLNIGPALPETIDFFANYRCRLHIADLLPELPTPVEADSEEGHDANTLQPVLTEVLALPDDTEFDIVFFWDALHFMSREAISALTAVLRPHLHRQSKAHCFAVHGMETPPAQIYHGIHDISHLSVRTRTAIPPNYNPLPQGQLVSLLKYFALDRSVLMRDRRIELLLKAAF